MSEPRWRCKLWKKSKSTLKYPLQIKQVNILHITCHAASLCSVIIYLMGWGYERLCFFQNGFTNEDVPVHHTLPLQKVSVLTTNQHFQKLKIDISGTGTSYIQMKLLCTAWDRLYTLLPLEAPLLQVFLYNSVSMVPDVHSHQSCWFFTLWKCWHGPLYVSMKQTDRLSIFVRLWLMQASFIKITFIILVLVPSKLRLDGFIQLILIAAWFSMSHK